MTSHHQAAEANIDEVIAIAQRNNGKNITTQEAMTIYASQQAISTIAIAQALLAINENLAAIRDTGHNPRCLALDPNRNPNKDPENARCIRGRDHDMPTHETKTGRRW